eukprot:116895_1
MCEPLKKVFRKYLFDNPSSQPLDTIRHQYHLNGDNTDNVKNFWYLCFLHKDREFVQDQIAKEFKYWLFTTNTDHKEPQCNIFCKYFLKIFQKDPKKLSSIFFETFNYYNNNNNNITYT